MKTESMMNSHFNVRNAISWNFAVVFFAIGVINTFWGNDPGFGISIIILSFIYVPHVNTVLKEKIGISIPAIGKILLGIFILWTALGVGELFDKIDLMVRDF